MSALLLILIIIVVVVFSRRGYSFGSRFFSGSVFKWTAIIYAVVLVSAAGTFFVVAEDRLHGWDRISADEQKSILELELRFNDLIMDGHLEELEETEGIFKTGAWRYDFTGDTLDIVTHHDMSYHNVYIDRVAELNDVIEINYYETRTIIMDDMEVTEQMSPPQLSFAENELRIQMEDNEFHFARFFNENVITQFSGLPDETDGGGSFLGMIIRQNAFIVRIPEHVHIVADHNIFVEELSKR